MSGLKNTAKRLINVSQPWNNRGYETNKEHREKKAAKKQKVLDEVYAGAQMPDEEQIARNERRKAAARRGSRQRNVLTDEDSLG